VNHEPHVRLRIEKALDKIQRAQGLIGEALQELSSIRGGLPTYNAGHKLYDKVHAYWYRVRALLDKSAKLTLDYEPEEKA
jgi:hypothetical protein